MAVLWKVYSSQQNRKLKTFSRMKPIKLSTWKIKLPLFPPTEVSDNSENSNYTLCPRLGLYQNGLRRGYIGTNFPIQFGLAYHKYRETIENLMIKQECNLTDEIHDTAVARASKGFVQPPLEHKHAHNNLLRLHQSCEVARDRVRREKEQGKIVVTKSEDSFDLDLPFVICTQCGFTSFELTEKNSCPRCTAMDVPPSYIVRARHGGRVDQFIRMVFLANGEFVKDFKTTGRMGTYYDLKFEPNSQMQGYVWSKEELSGISCDGVLVETLYNTKNEGPKIFQTWKSFSEGQQEQWVASVMMERQMIQLMWSRVDELGYLAFPQRTDSCDRFGGCDYREACLAGSGFEIEQWLENYTEESHWDFTNPEGEKG